MPDSALSALALGTSPAFYYGLDAAGLSKRFNTSAVINVADFPGVDRNGVADSAAGIQAAFDLAFGPASAPHGNGGKNRPVYFPVGNYKILTPLRGTAIWGGKIFGDGMLQSNITYSGPLTPVNADNIVPTLWFDACNFCELSNLSLGGPADPTNHRTACLWFGPSGVQGSSAHGNLISNLSTGGASFGVVHGSVASQANSENTYLNCRFGGPHETGFFCSGQNTLNIRIIGGGIDSCSVAGIRTNNGAQINVIQSVAFANNALDIDLVVTSRSVISGIRSESTQFCRFTSTGPWTLLNCHMSAGSGVVVGSVSGTTLTVTSITSGGNSALWPGRMVFGSDGINSLPNAYNSGAAGQGVTRIVQQLAGAPNGIGTYQLSQASTPGNIAAGTSFRIVPVFAELMGGSSLSAIDCGSNVNDAIIGDGNSVLFVHNNQWFEGGVDDLLTAFRGQVFAYDRPAVAPTVANLPTPRACLKGVRMFALDSSVTTFGATVAGGGSNAVPVWCDGAAWKVG